MSQVGECGRFGLIVPICTVHGMQDESLRLARAHSRPETPVIALFNGQPAFAVPDGVEVVALEYGFADERDMWQWGLDRAIRDGWDWCFYHHDDFLMCEPGWEDELKLASDWRVATASHCAYSEWNEQANSGISTTHHLGVTIDSASFAFRVSLFADRGCVTDTRYGFGYGCWDACAWGLSMGYGAWRIQRRSNHHWLETNTRSILRLGADGHQDIAKRWNNIALPAYVIDEYRIRVVNDIIDCSPGRHG